MAVERPIGEPNTDIEIEGVTIETPDMEVEAIEMQEDVSAIVNPEPEMTDVQFDSNLAEYIEDDELGKISSTCLLYTSPSPRDRQKSRMPSSA